MVRSGLPSNTSIAVIAALARYGGKDAENTYPELLNRCQIQYNVRCNQRQEEESPYKIAAYRNGNESGIEELAK